LNKLFSYKNYRALFLSALFVCFYSFSYSQQIELVHSDNFENATRFFGAGKLNGNVHFRTGNRNLYCDSAFFHKDENWVRAYSHVQINQADTLNLFCDSLYFDGKTNIGILRSNVRFRDNEFKMTTDSLKFDANQSIGYYTNWAKITSINQDLKLTSKIGYYYANSKTFFFKDSVNVSHPNYSLLADTLEFRTNSETVLFHGPTQINFDSTTVLCNKGYYETNNEFLNLWNGATIYNDSTSTLYADSLIYSQEKEIAEGFYNVSVYDSLEKIQLKSDYLIQFIKMDSIVLKNNARIYQYNKKDTLFLRADTIYQTKDSLTQKKLSIAIGNVVIINSGVVGICDSIYYNETDSILKLRKTPILWQESTQLFGDSIDVLLIKNDIDKIFLFNNAMVITQQDSIHFDQLSGKKITANFIKGEINDIFIDGSAQTIYYPSETDKDSTNTDIKNLKGQNNLISEQILIYFKKSEIQKIKFIDQPDAKFIPIDQIIAKELYLQNFNWKIEEKPSVIILK